MIASVLHSFTIVQNIFNLNKIIELHFFSNDLAAKVFKIIHDKQKGPLTLVRLFRGSLNKGMRLVTSKGTNEVLQRIYEPLADEYREITSINAGDIAVCAGFKVCIFKNYIKINLILVYFRAL